MQRSVHLADIGHSQRRVSVSQIQGDAVLAFILCAMSASALAAGPLPQGGQIVAGTGSIATNATAVNITQNTPRAVIDWRSFSIGNGNTVNVNNGTGATLSRVTGSDRSSIDGKLAASGSFYLINPQGVVVGPSGVVTTGGRFVASTLDIANNNFMNGGPLNLTGSADGVIVNLGKISSTGGDVFLIARKLVENDGSISAPKGSAELATGSQVLLKDSATGPQVFVQAGTNGDVVNKGTIEAAQIDLRAADGNVFALAGQHDDLRATGTATREGKVWLVADRGTAHVHSKVEASNADGTGGTVITTGNTLHLDDAAIDAASWNISAPEFNAGPLNSATLARNLSGGTSITVNATGGTGGSGNINLGAAVRWTGDASLTLSAVHDVTLGPLVTLANTGAGNLTLRADSHASDNGGSILSSGTLDWSQGLGIISAFYDMNGTYTRATVRQNESWKPAPYSGLKTQYTVYQLVNSNADLVKMGDNLAANYALGRNLDLAPDVGKINVIGGGIALSGQFDGMGHTISHFNGYQVGTEPTLVGLFGAIYAGGVVRNLGVIDSSASGSYNTPAGILAGLNSGLVSNVYTTGSTGSPEETGPGGGGLVARNEGTIERSWSSASVGGQGDYGGLVGVNNGKIVQSFATGTVSGGSHAEGGGLVSQNSGSITQSYASGSAQMYYNGGLVLDNTSIGTISESFATTHIVPQFDPALKGGVAFSNAGAIANNVYWDVGMTTASNSVYGGTPVPAANGLSTVQMRTASSFDSSWDFSPAGTWALPAGAQHPVLRWQLGAQ
ncbi:two-partner secretion domain-containing protein [Caballeronia telluris]|uniref:Filamentous hemagglutinin-like protein n=1 Tax=Caballeronia telluris TaxID=326475 RepID=A0A158GA74_9BURK|nr:filamentous hemagglutinin N-terminal domain-containing protein [Caballeronia telluris]SAL28783.1 filamentous hemagglutinin-like protein [Caballeronia telluris]